MKGYTHLVTLFLKVLLFSSFAPICRCEIPEMTLAEKAEIFAQLSQIPLSKNPFFIKSIANSGLYDGEGTEGLTPDVTGHSCRWIGNMECKSFYFQCDGEGIVDCTGDCPGDEDAVSKMIAMMEDKELIQSFPLLAQMKAESEKDPEKAKRGKDRFVQVLKNCNYGGLVALVGLSDGIDFGSQSNNDSLTFVDDKALSGFDYDYEDGTTSELDKVEGTYEMNDTRSISKGKDDMADLSKMEDTASNEMIKKIPVRESTIGESRTLKFEMVEKTKQKTAIDLVKSEVRVLRSVFLTAIDEADGVRSNSQKIKRSDEHLSLIYGLVEDLKLQTPSMRRRIRSVAENMTSSNVTIKAEKCKVQNISCAIFPTTSQCTGIALGGCMSHLKFLASLFTPRVIMFIIGGIVVIIALAIAIGFFFSKRKRMQAVEPVEQQETTNTQQRSHSIK